MCRHHQRRRGWFFLKFFFIIAALALMSLVLMLLWNAVIPELFGLRSISFPQALGLFILSKILFTGVHRRGWGHYGYPGYWSKRHQPDKDPQPGGSEGTEA